MEQEESYTSKASLVDGDKIPVVGDQEKPSFSGKRVSGRLYCTKEQMLINADLNGAGNILRKAYPTAFEGITDYHFLNKMIVKNTIPCIPEMDSSPHERACICASGTKPLPFFVRENASGSS